MAEEQTQIHSPRQDHPPEGKMAVEVKTLFLLLLCFMLKIFSVGWTHIMLGFFLCVVGLIFVHLNISGGGGNRPEPGPAPGPSPEG